MGDAALKGKVVKTFVRMTMTQSDQVSAPVSATIRRDGRALPGSSMTTFLIARIARHCVADVLRCEPLAMMGKARGSRKLAYARQLAIHLTHIVAGRSASEVAKAFGRNRATAGHHFEIVENLRDLTEFDDFISLMEQRFTLMLAIAEQKPKGAWRQALVAMRVAVAKASLEADAHFAAKHVSETFEDGE